MWGAVFRKYVSDSLLAGIVAHSLFEWFESRPATIAAFSNVTNYYGDSFINIVGDTVSFVIGFNNESLTNELIIVSIVIAAYLIRSTNRQ